MRKELLRRTSKLDLYSTELRQITGDFKYILMVVKGLTTTQASNNLEFAPMFGKGDAASAYN